jgi:hypothetical protein
MCVFFRSKKDGSCCKTITTTTQWVDRRYSLPLSLSIFLLFFFYPTTISLLVIRLQDPTVLHVLITSITKFDDAIEEIEYQLTFELLHHKVSLQRTIGKMHYM